jgi:hypothetical protein
MHESLDYIRARIVCPVCRGTLAWGRDNTSRCVSCTRHYTVSKNVPVLRDTSRAPLVVMPMDHVSNSFADDLPNRFGRLTPDAPLLFLGAGATTRRIPHSVEVEFNQFIHTDIIADAHCLPFEDNTFGGCLCLNTFEHLYDPSNSR